MKCSIILSILHELNHYLRRYGLNNKDCSTCDINGRKANYDGGELMFDAIFGVKLFETLNRQQAKYLLDLNNWNMDTIQFRGNLEKIEKEGTSYIKCMESYEDKSWHCIFPNSKGLVEPSDLKEDE